MLDSVDCLSFDLEYRELSRRFSAVRLEWEEPQPVLLVSTHFVLDIRTRYLRVELEAYVIVVCGWEGLQKVISQCPMVRWVNIPR